MQTEPIEDVIGTALAAAEDAAPTDADASARSEEAIDIIDRLLDQVDQALIRLDDGTYGTCQACGGAIGDDRLAARPTALECGACDTDDQGTVPDQAMAGASVVIEPGTTPEAGRMPGE